MLALVGSGEYLPGVDPIDRYLLSQLKDPPRVVCLPTAAGTEGPTVTTERPREATRSVAIASTNASCSPAPAKLRRVSSTAPPVPGGSGTP